MHLDDKAKLISKTPDDQRLDGRIAIVTGANTGLGKETTKQLARKGCRVIMACRSDHLGLVTREELLKNLEIRCDDLVCMTLDLGNLKSVRQFVDEFCANEAHLNYLINNAGVYSGQQTRIRTVDGFESHFGVNHLGHFLLTVLLLDKMKASAPARIINVTCEAYRYGKLDLEDPHLERKWSCFRAYAKSKTANLLFTIALGKRLAETGVSAYAYNPGIILNKTDIMRNMEKHKANILKCLIKIWFFNKMGTVSQGAKGVIYCCTEPRLAEDSGSYYSSTGCQLHPKPHATDQEVAEGLWRHSEELTGLKTKSIRRK